MEQKQTAVEWLFEKINMFCMFTDGIPDEWSEALEQAKEMEKEQKNNLPIHIHEGIKNTWVYIEDGIVHVKPNP